MKDQVVLVSLDGMPAKVFENAWKYHSSDIHVQELWTVYPSITVPAHVSILTGKTPQEHGIMENLVMEGPGFEKISLYRPTVEEARRIMPQAGEQGNRQQYCRPAVFFMEKELDAVCRLR